MKFQFLKETLSLLALGNKIRDSLHRLGLLFLRRDRGGHIFLLRPVIAELGVIAALNFHHVLCVVDLVLHTLVQGAVDGNGIGRRIVAIEVAPSKIKPSTSSGCSEANWEAMAPHME